MARAKKSKRNVSFPRLRAALMNSVSVLALGATSALALKPAGTIKGMTAVKYHKGVRYVISLVTGEIVNSRPMTWDEVNA